MDLLIKANDIRAEFAARDVLNIDEVELYDYDRIGLVGDNGAGKSTLLHVLTGALELPDCKVQRFGSITYIPQLEDAAPQEQHDPAMLSRLGVSELNVETMSGGEETRLKIAAALSGQAHAIFADEPTSHLDRAGIELLIGQLKTFDGALLVVSHDRFFLDSVVDKIWELKDAKISEYWGGYSEYLQQKADERAAQAEQYEQAMQERERLERAAIEKRKQAKQIKKSAKEMKKIENAGRGHRKSEGTKEKSLHTAAKNMEHRMDALSDIKAPEAIRTVRFRQSSALELHNKFPITGENIHLRYGDRVIFDGGNFVIPLGAKVALTGGNGAGKTTLLRMILEGMQGLTISPKAVIGYFAQTGYKLQTDESVISFMQTDCDYTVWEIRSVLASMGFGPRDIMKPLRVLSGGEMIKLTLSKMLTGRYNILLMDEPGNYLDLRSLEALENMIKGYVGTIVFVSHDQRLIENAADVVYEIKDCKMRKVR